MLCARSSLSKWDLATCAAVMGRGCCASSAGGGKEDREVMAVVVDRLDGIRRMIGERGELTPVGLWRELREGFLFNVGVNDRSVEDVALLL